VSFVSLMEKEVITRISILLELLIKKAMMNNLFLLIFILAHSVLFPEATVDKETLPTHKRVILDGSPSESRARGQEAPKLGQSLLVGDEDG
jgi:hypothetical protein